jgi:histidyl-tRNA synthetase
MSTAKLQRPKARLPRGFRDRAAGEIAAERKTLDTIRSVYQSYGFEALETPAFEFTDALGKFLPDVDRPNEGVFSLRDDDEQWLSLRYDLTAPLARYVAENFQDLPKPFRRYQVGSVWRNEKPGPGRFREFTQFDADTVGSAAPSADAEILMMVRDALEKIGLGAGEFVVKVNNRKLLDGVMDAGAIAPGKRGTVLRAIDKLDRLGVDGVRLLLGKGRKDESGDFTRGAELDDAQIARVVDFVAASTAEGNPLEHVARLVEGTRVGEDGIRELDAISGIVKACGYDETRIRMDPGIIRGLEYYTGPVFEAQLQFAVANEAGEQVVFGSVAGGGRYDGLVARFMGQEVPATGISIGVSRLLSALAARGLTADAEPLVFVLALDDVPHSFATARELRAAGFRAETYVGAKKFGDQLKYADKRGAVLAIIEGGDERKSGQVTIKNLATGHEASKTIASRAEWLGGRQAQVTVPRSELVAQVAAILAPAQS